VTGLITSTKKPNKALERVSCHLFLGSPVLFNSFFDPVASIASPRPQQLIRWLPARTGMGALPLLRQQANKVPTLVRASAIVFASCLNYSLPDYLFRIPIVANITPVVCRIIKLRRGTDSFMTFKKNVTWTTRGVIIFEPL